MASKGIPKSLRRFEKQLAEHRLKRDAHQQLIDTLKEKRSKFGDVEAIDSDNEE